MFPKINWRTIPFIRLIIPFMLGIWCNNQIGESLPYPILLLSIVLLLSFGIFKIATNIQFRWIIGVWMSLAFFLFGWQIMYWNNPTIYTNHYEQFIGKQAEKTKYWVIGEIANIPTTKNTTRIEIEIEKIGTHQDSLQNVFGKVTGSLKADSLAQTLTFGDRIMFYTYVNKVQTPKNPNQFDYRQFLKYKKIYRKVYLSPNSWYKLKNKSKGIFYTINNIRSKRVQQIKEHIDSEAEQGVAMALLLGFKDELSTEIKESYAETGAIHVLAVSGLHVGIVAAIFLWTLSRFRWKRKWLKIILVIVPLWFYAFLTGLSPSVIRATVMFSLIIIGRESKRQSNIYNVLAASALILLIYNPYFLFSVGFQLSYAAVLGIIYLQPRIAVWLLPQNKIVNYFWQLTAVSIAATLGTLPFTLYYFHQFPIWFWLSSAIVIPAAGLILSVGILFFTLGLVPVLGTIIGFCLKWIIFAMNWLVAQIHHFPISIIKGLWFSNLEFYLLLCFVLTIGLLLQTRRFRWSLFSMSFVAVLVSFSFLKSWNATKQKEIIVYNLYNETAIDFIDGQEVTTFQSKSISQENYQFTTKTHHWYRNISTIDSVKIDSNFTSSHLNKTNDLIQFYDKTILIIDDTFEPTQEKIKVDYILICNMPRIKMQTIVQTFDFETIIFDGSNKWWQINNWKTECETLKVNYQDVQNDFAFVLSF